MRIATIVAVAVLPAAVVRGQTNDHLFRSWRWGITPGAPRPAGLAGAFVAVADDASASWLNPAGLTTLPKTEIGGGILSARSGHVRDDRLGAWSGLGYIAGAGRLSKRFALGGYVTRPRSGRIDLAQDIPLPDGSRADGYLKATIVDGGVVGSYRLTSRLNVGARVTATHLELEGLYRRYAPAGRLALESGTAAGTTRLTGTFGALYEATRGLKLGLLVTPGASYLAERTANDPTGAVDVGSRYELRAPGLVSTGAALQFGARLLLTAQVDYVRYSEIRAFVRPGAAQASGYAIEDGIEPRLGAELSWPVRGLAVQLRGGVHSQAPGSLRFQGGDAVEAAAFPGSPRRHVAAAGASVVTRAGLRFDVAAVFGGDRNEVLAGCRLRF